MLKRLRDVLLLPRAHLAAVAAAGLLAYANSFGVPFTFDDRRCIVDSPVIRSLDYFASPGRAASLPSSLQCGFPMRFMGHLSLAVNYRLGGLEVAGYHLFNLAVHLANALLVYLLVSLTFRTPLFERDQVAEEVGQAPAGRRLAALFSALLFACHPLQTQAVTYLTQRFASLAALFYLLAGVLYARYRLSGPGAGRAAWYAGALSSTAVAMLTKESSFTLPFALALYELIFLRGGKARRLLGLAPFFLTLAIFPAVLGFFSGSAGEIQAYLSTAGRSPLTRWQYLLTQFRVVVSYLRLFILPVGQNLDHDHPQYRSLLQLPVLLSLGLLLAVLAAGVLFLVRSRRRGAEASPELALAAWGIFWFFLALAVESGLAPLSDVIFEHRMYLPSVGLCTAVAVLAFQLRDRLERVRPAAAALIAPALSAAVLALAGATYARNAVWGDEVRLWEDAARKSPAKVRPRMELGALHLAANRLADAGREIRTAIALAPDYPEAHNSLGVVQRRQGRLQEAMESYLTALRLKPDFAEARANIGLLHAAQGLRDDAVRDLEAAIRMKPDYPEAHNNLGVLYAQEGRLEEAIREFQATLALNPAHAKARSNLSAALGASGR